MVELLDIDLGHNVLRFGEMRFQILKIRTIYCMRSRFKEVTRPKGANLGAVRQ